MKNSAFLHESPGASIEHGDQGQRSRFTKSIDHELLNLTGCISQTFRQRTMTTIDKAGV